MFKHNMRVSIATLVLLYVSATVFGQGTAFTYQGKLTDSGNPASGQFDFQFKLFDMQTVGTGSQQGSTVLVPNVTVTTGIFTVQLDFGACASCFNGAARFLEIAVKPTGGPTFTTLSSRQPVTSGPYAIRSLNAGNAATADALSGACSSCVTSSQIGSVNGSAVTGTIPVASVPAGSSNYIQNTTSPQASSNFNISGNGTAAGTLSGNIINATTQYNIGGFRIMSTPGQTNMFVGSGAGSPNVSGTSNSFFGNSAGFLIASGGSNSFFGSSAGERTSSGGDNSFFGVGAGQFNTSGGSNSFFGFFAGRVNDMGLKNSFFGASAGISNTGTNNTFIGEEAGNTNTTGSNNTILGQNGDVGSGQSHQCHCHRL